MSTIQECLQKAIDLANQVDTNTQNIAALDVRVSALEGVTPPPEPPSPSPSPEPQPPTPPSPSPSPEPQPPDENPAIAAARIRSHFLPGSVVVNPGTNGQDIEGALATGRAEFDLGTYPQAFKIRNAQSLVGVPYGSKCSGRITVEAGAKFLMRGLIADGSIVLEPGGDEPTGGAIELTVGNITGNGANLQDMAFISCDGQHDFQDVRMHNVEFARTKSHNAGASPEAPALRIHGRSRADVTGLVIDSFNTLQCRHMSMDFQHMEDVVILGSDDESYEDRKTGPASINLVDIGTATLMGIGGNAGANVDGIRCENVDCLRIISMGQNPAPGHVAINISGAKQAWLVHCSEMSITDNGGVGRIKQAKNCTMTKSGQVDPALLGDGTPLLGWAREVPERPAAFTPPTGQPDETEAINAMGSYVRLEDRPYRADGVHLTGGRVFRGGPNTTLFSEGGPVITQRQGSGAGMPTTSGAILLDVRLHGGSEGMLFGEPNVQVNNMVLSGVTFSGYGNAGIYVHNTYAIDNCVSRCVTFDGPCSLMQRGTDDGSGTGQQISYIDKWFWDRSQHFGAKLDLQTTRASNLNIWRKGYSENCVHRIASGYNYTMFVGHSFNESKLDTDLNEIYCVDCDVTLGSGNAFGFGTLAEGTSFDLRGDAKPFMTAVPLQWQLYFINAGAYNCVAPNTDPEYVNTPAGTPGISLFSAMSTWKGGSPWQGPKLRVSSLDTKGSNDMGDDVRTNQNVIE